MPRPSIGDVALTGAQRQARYRAARAEALRAIVELDLSELQAVVPPRGFGRD